MALTRRKLLVATAGLATLFVGCGEDQPPVVTGNLVAPPPPPPGNGYFPGGPYYEDITDVTPVSAQTVVEKERPVTAFTIRATYRQADSAYIRTVPLSQSVR